MCMVEYGEPATIYNARVVAHSRKPRRCEECRRSIEIGDAYHSASMLYDGLWSTFDTCEHCMAAQRWLIAQCGGFLHGGVDEDLREHLTELTFRPGEAVALLRIIVGIRRQWKSFADPAKLMPVLVR